MKNRSRILTAYLVFATGLGMTSCSESTGLSYQTLPGRVIGETETSFTIDSNGKVMELPKNIAGTDNQKIFIEDSIVINIADSAGVSVIKDVMLISHSQQMSNVMELFVGSWKVDNSDEKITFNSDLTTSSSKKWSIDGRKMLIHNGAAADEYDIVSINDKNMVLCFDNRTINLSRAE